MNKTCTHCNKNKNVSEFHRSKVSDGGYKNICKSCHKELYGNKSSIKKKEIRESKKQHCFFCNSIYFGKKRKYCSDNCQEEANKNRRRSKLDSELLVRLKLKDKGLYKCKDCGTIGNREDKYHRENICTDCRNKRKKEYRKKLLSEDSIAKKAIKIKEKNKLLDDKIIYQFDKIFKSFIDNCEIKQVVNKFYINKPWANPNLSRADKHKLRYKYDPEFNAKERLRNQVTKKIKMAYFSDDIRFAIARNGQSNKVEKILGFTIQQFMIDFESKFTKGMSWESFNRGEIHIDHIMPKSWFNYKSINDYSFKKCWSLKNLQPLWAKDNLVKSNKYIG